MLRANGEVDAVPVVGPVGDDPHIGEAPWFGSCGCHDPALGGLLVGELATADHSERQVVLDVRRARLNVIKRECEFAERAALG